MIALAFVAGVIVGWFVTTAAVCVVLVIVYDRIEEADKDV